MGYISQTSSTTSSATFTWGPTGSGYTYEIFVNGSRRGTTSSTSYTVTGMSPGGSASVGVAIWNAQGREIDGASGTVYARYNTPSASISAGTTSISVSLSGASGANYWMSCAGQEVYSSSYTFTGLSPGTTYTVYYAAFGRSSTFQNSATGSRSVTTRSLPQLGTPVITSVSPNRKSVWVDWNNVSGADEYLVQVRSGSTVVRSVWSTISETTVTGLSPNTSYNVRVMAYDWDGNYQNSNWSSAVNFTTLPIPAPPTFNTPTYNAATNELTISWSSVSGATRYRLEWGPAPNYTSARELTTTSTVITGLERGITYAFRVAHEGTEWSYSESGWRTTLYELPAGPPLPTPTNFTVGTRRYISVDLSWSAVPNAGGYYYEARTGGNLVSGYPKFTTSTSVIASGLSPGTSYTFGVQAVDFSNNYSPSGWAYASGSTLAAPSPPSILQIQTVTVEGVRGVMVEWSEVLYASSYALQWKLKSDTVWNTDNRSTLFSIIYPPTPGVYQFRVAANGNEIPNGSTGYSGIAEFEFTLRPTNFEWDTPKVSGQPFNLRAVEWNRFIDKIHEFRNYKNLPYTYISYAVPGAELTASMFNEALQAIRQCNPQISPPSNVKSGDSVYASLLNAIVNSLNSIQ